VGGAGYPMDSLTFESQPFSDPQGAGTFGAMQWRLAEVLNTNQPPLDPRMIPPMEWDTLWNSGKIVTWSNRITIPGTFVQTTKVYRVRVRHMDNTGRWSKWSAPVQFSPSAVDVTATLRESLRLSELMYNPPPTGIYDSDDLEFLELSNTGSTMLDLSGLTFTGITYSFPAGATIQPGQKLVLGRNPEALRIKYPGLVVDGVYSGKLDNAGELIRLNTPSGVTVVEALYDNNAPWPAAADGMGYSLVIGDAGLPYRASAHPGGSPGYDDPLDMQDSDGDGLPDSWEQEHATNLNLNDANSDPDNDGFSNLHEYLAGTDPQDKTSALRLTGVQQPDHSISLSFQAVAGKSYSLLNAPGLTGFPWVAVTNITASSTNRLMNLNPPATGTLFYRLVTPAKP
jgi:hypothetical protein